MSNKFYAYVREFYPVYEPAEGGYYVCCSQITDLEEHSDLNEAVYSLLCGLVDAAEHGSVINYGSWNIGFDVKMWDDDGTMTPDITLRLPRFVLDKDGYIGSGFEMGICATKPEDEPYEGYC